MAPVGGSASTPRGLPQGFLRVGDTKAVPKYSLEGHGTRIYITQDFLWLSMYAYDVLTAPGSDIAASHAVVR